MSNKSSFLKGVSIQSVITLAMGLSELLVFSVMTRLLTKEDFGYYAALMGIVAVCTSITEAGLGSAIIQKKDASPSFIRTSFTLSWIIGAIGTFLMFIFAPLVANTIGAEHIIIALRILSINIFLACTASVGKAVLMRELKFKTYGTFEILSYALSSTLGISLALVGLGLYAILSISVCNFILLNLILYTKSVKLPKFGIVNKEIKGIFSFGGWLTLSVVVNQVTQQLDRLFMPRWLSVVALGAYNRPAGFLSTITGKINGIFDTVLFPILSKIQLEPVRIRQVFLRSITLLNSLSSVLFCIIFFNAHLIVSIFFGDQWMDLVPVFQIISIYVIFNIDNRLVDCFFRSLNLVKLGFCLRVVAAFVTFIFLYFGCKHGLSGAAIALTSANIFTASMKLFALSKTIKVQFRVVLRNIMIACKPMLLLLGIGIPYNIYIAHSMLNDVIFAIILGILILVEFVLFPSMVGREYKETVYRTIISKLSNNNK